jgi:hypothetical protein
MLIVNNTQVYVGRHLSLKNRAVFICVVDIRSLFILLDTGELLTYIMDKNGTLQVVI